LATTPDDFGMARLPEQTTFSARRRPCLPTILWSAPNCRSLLLGAIKFKLESSDAGDKGDLNTIETMV
jgi:hypothetical protein